MDEQVREYVEQYPSAIVNMYHVLRTLILNSAPAAPQEKLWAKLPSYYVGEAFVRLIPSKDHINIEASAAAAHRQELAGYKMTPKGMLQIFLGQGIPGDALRQIFEETLH